MSEYSALERLLHRVALSRPFVGQAALDIELALNRPDLRAVEQGRHVFVAGLARAGTSILLRMLAGTDAFAVQTYRDMPFVLAPSLWRRISRPHARRHASTERAHGDGLAVDADSPEAFEEVFWLSHAAQAYVRPDHLLAHAVDDELGERFRAFIGAVLGASPDRTRYLSKNTNNLLRLPGLAAALPRATIIVPFRDPLQQAISLHRQHRHFSALQRKDSFGRRYMGWLGHHEFGLDHRPFRHGSSPRRDPGLDAQDVDYWLDLWTRCYAGALETAPALALFFDYDRFCADPATEASRLLTRLDLPDVHAETIRAPADRAPDRKPDRRLLAAAAHVHDALRERSGAVAASARAVALTDQRPRP